MTDLIRLNPTRWPYSLAQLRLDEPSRSFSPAPSDGELAAYDVFRVRSSDPPAVDPLTERAAEVAPVQVNGAWEQQWQVVELSKEERAAAFRALNPPQWVAFGAAVQANPGINALLGVALQNVPALAMSLSVGLGKAADGDSRVFMEAWMFARSLELVSAELIATMQTLATQYDLPSQFVTALGAEALDDT